MAYYAAGQARRERRLSGNGQRRGQVRNVGSCRCSFAARTATLNGLSWGGKRYGRLRATTLRKQSRIQHRFPQADDLSAALYLEHNDFVV